MLSNTLTRRVEWDDRDPAGIVFNPDFFRRFDPAAAILYEAVGWPRQEMPARSGAAGCPLVETGANFRAPCRHGDDVRIASAFAGIGRSSFDLRHSLAGGETICVEGFETRVRTVRDPESGAIRSSPLPEDLISRFRGEKS